MKKQCQYCHAKAKKLAENLGYPGVCLKHLRIEITKEVNNVS